MRAPKLELERVTRPEDAQTAAAILVSAFADDPAWTARFPRRKRRQLVLHSAIAALVQHAATRGGLVLARLGDDAVAATVAWTPDDHPRPWRREYLRAAVAIAARTGSGCVGLARRYAALRRVDSRFPPHWHLAIIGVRPDLQREQVGTQLLANFLERVDAASEPAYLETTRVELLGWYRRFGFEVRERLNLPGGRRAWIMWREPRHQVAPEAASPVMMESEPRQPRYRWQRASPSESTAGTSHSIGIDAKSPRG